MSKPFNVFHHLLLPDVLLATVLALDASRIWRVLFFASFTYASLEAIGSTLGDILWDYNLGILTACQWFTALHLLLLENPLTEYRHSTDEGNTPSEYGLLYRIYWCECVIHSVRGIGWNFQLKHVFARPSAGSSRAHFVKTRLLPVLYCILLLDLAQSYMSYNPRIFTYSEHAESVASQGYWRRCLHIFISGINPYCGLSFPYYLVSALHVAAGLSKPTDWPDPFGSIKEAYTIRRFWTKFWHQLMNRNIIAMGHFVTNFLGLRERSWAKYIVGVLVGFAVSGAIHVTGDAVAGPQNIGKSMLFFVLQAVGIAVEQAVIQLAYLCGIGGPRRWLGYLWVAFWFSVSAVGFVDWGIQVGFFYKDALPFSPTRYLIILIFGSIPLGKDREH